MARRVALSCACGSVAGHMDIGSGRHIACHCADCAAWRDHLTPGREGGVEIFQTTPDRIEIIQGAENLACARLTKQGLVRWYAACCNTAIANSLPKPMLPFAGVVTDCIAEPDKPKIGPVASVVNRKQKPGNNAASAAIWGALSRGVGARLSGKERFAPFFSPDGMLAKEPEIIG